MSMAPKKLVSKTFLISLVGVSSMGPVIPIPALFTSTSKRPSFSKIKSIAKEIVSGFVTSKGINEYPFFSFIFAFLPVPYTLKPLFDKSLAVDFPIPEEAPVIKTTLDIKKMKRFIFIQISKKKRCKPQSLIARY